MDNTLEVVQKWIKSVDREYHSIDFEYVNSNANYQDAKGIAHWSEQRFSHIIHLRETALNIARNKWADYYLVCHILFFYHIKS